MKSSLGILFWGCALMGLIVGLACRPQPVASPSWMSNDARRPERELIAVLCPPAEEARKLVRILRSELSLDFDVHVFSASRDMQVGDVGAIVQGHEPSAVILVDNPTVRIYGAWARTQSAPPPSIIVMSSFAGELQGTVPNSSGISFEPPAVTSLSDVRRILAIPVSRVGVVYRDGFEGYVSREKESAAREMITLIPARVKQNPTAADVHRALNELREMRIDALWVSNDNALLTSPLLHDAWFPFVEREDLPVVVGVPALIGPNRRFGTFAAVPDIEGIGLQTADLVLSLQESGWKSRGLKVQPPVSVKTYVDVINARRLGMREESELTVDVLVTEVNEHGHAR